MQSALLMNITVTKAYVFSEIQHVNFIYIVIINNNNNNDNFFSISVIQALY